MTTILHMIATQGVSDSGATGNVVLPDDPVSHIKPTQAPLTNNLPNKNQLNTTHTFQLDIPCIPNKDK